ncbi:MAG: 4-hydroxy-3-methylbut-2-enyl diphosphate reductase [Chloroflexi bacterium]|jgi:(E)-4-hydroxy-3-methyl-but-2-enyl pyrophosphate reductase|nr:4-hydroxy-3-methylbut-2-enyl diphosphate reductase [Chloroflexota bacterium]NCA13219.1 4-hydroxy-3-methylbut-2-enyl diphosphate reductase [Pseudomonadota bacterium]
MEGARTIEVRRVKTYAGFCGGVKRAWNRAVKASKSTDEPILLSGKLIHNTPAMRELASMGVRVATDEDLAQETVGRTYIMRAHGEGPEAFEAAQARGFNVIDATCPIVTAVQKIAVQLEDEGFQVVLFGHRDHPEARATVAYTKRGFIIESAEEARALPFYPKLATIAQTTVLQADYLEVVEALKARADVFEDRGRVCGWTLHAQDEALALAQEVDAMVVVGGRDSSNTIQLVRVCETACPTFHVESPDELRAEWFSQASVVGIAAGASTREVDLASSISFLESLPAAPGAVAVA